MPGFAQLTKIQFTTATENQVPFNSSYFDDGETININERTITISSPRFSTHYSSITLLEFSNKSESDYGTVLAIDEIVLTYTC